MKGLKVFLVTAAGGTCSMRHRDERAAKLPFSQYESAALESGSDTCHNQPSSEPIANGNEQSRFTFMNKTVPIESDPDDLDVAPSSIGEITVIVQSGPADQGSHLSYGALVHRQSLHWVRNDWCQDRRVGQPGQKVTNRVLTYIRSEVKSGGGTALRPMSVAS
jgi:hypothetical protein